MMKPWRVYAVTSDRIEALKDSASRVVCSYPTYMTLVQAIRRAILKQVGKPHLTYVVEHAITRERFAVHHLMEGMR